MSQFPFFNPKLILTSLLLIFIVFVVLRSNYSSSLRKSSLISTIYPSYDATISSPEENGPANCDSLTLIPTCTKITPSLAEALVHYATSRITPQQTYKEISVSMKLLEKKSPCNFLVFGLGHDSLMWTALNHGGRTVFLEEAKSWIDQIKEELPNLESYHVEYDTKLTQAGELMEIGMKDDECKVLSDPRDSKCGLALKGFPKEVYEMEWDLIMVDAPTGYRGDRPGRMKAIYTAGLMARIRKQGETDVFVHDVDRWVENMFSMAFLCEGYWRDEVGKLRHFTIPSHYGRPDLPFCPKALEPY